MGDLFIFIVSLIDHATGVSVDLNLLKEWISMDLSPFIDTEHVKSLGLYMPLSRARSFSFSDPVISTIESISDIAPIFSIFPAHFLEQCPRFKGRQLLFCQAIHPSTAEHQTFSGNIGALQGFLADQTHGVVLISAIFNLISQHTCKGSPHRILGSSCINSSTKQRTIEIFGIIKSHAVSAQRALDRKALILDLSVLTLFHLPPLLMLLAPDMSSAWNGSSQFHLPHSSLPSNRTLASRTGRARYDENASGQLPGQLTASGQDDLGTSRANDNLSGSNIFTRRHAVPVHTGTKSAHSSLLRGIRQLCVLREILGPDPIPAYSALPWQLQDSSESESDRALQHHIPSTVTWTRTG